MPTSNPLSRGVHRDMTDYELDRLRRLQTRIDLHRERIAVNTDSRNRLIRRLAREGVSPYLIAKRIDLSAQRVHQILSKPS